MEDKPTFPVGIAAVFYAVLAALGIGLASIWDLDVWTWREGWTSAGWIDGLIGAGFGIAVVVLSGILEEHTTWAARLSQEFKKILGPISVAQAFVLALFSGIAEEVFFRGFLQQVLTEVALDGVPGAVWIGLVVASLIFGLVHQGPDREVFLPWTIFAIVVGLALGLLYVATGNLLAPVIAHFTINFLNLSLLGTEENDA